MKNSKLESNVSETLISETPIAEESKKEINKSFGKLDLEKFDGVFEVEFWNWDDEVIEFIAQITGITEAKNFSGKIYTANVRLANKLEKTVKFTAYSSMATQFKNLDVKIGSVCYIKHLGAKPALNHPETFQFSCVVRKLK